MLDSQVQKVLDYIEANPDVSPARLCEEFGVSDRTIRTYVKKLNAVLEPQAHIHKHRGGGYTLNISDCDAYRSIRDDASNGGLKSIPSTSEGRVEYLLNDLLSRVDWITLDDLSEILYVSRNAISGDLKRVEAQLAKFDLKLERRPHYGIRVSGSEMSRRLCLANITLDKLAEHRESDSQNQVTLDTIATCVNEVIAEEGFQINSAAYQNLLVHIAVAIWRIRRAVLRPARSRTY